MGPEEFEFAVGDNVEKVGGDYSFVGHVVSTFHKRSGLARYVVEDDRGVLHVFNGRIMRLVGQGETSVRAG
ncbi:hypothetical protein P67b_00052 [Ruegeria phage Tedan]|nr:hypothetical protein P67b_00052 [Ruegeria phage Tedan]